MVSTIVRGVRAEKRYRWSVRGDRSELGRPAARIPQFRRTITVHVVPIDVVEDRVTDGRRIAELLASEIEGRTDGAFDRLAIVDANPDANPDANRDTAPGDGDSRAYDVARDGKPFARVFVRPERADLVLLDDSVRRASVETHGLEESTSDDDASDDDSQRLVVHVPSGAAVKRATDLLDAASRGLD